MGNEAIAAQLKDGIKQAVDQLGETVTVRVQIIETLIADASRPSAGPQTSTVESPIDGIVNQFAEDLIDGELIKRGDLELTIVAGGTVTEDSVVNLIIVNEAGYRVMATRNTRVAGVIVSHQFQLRK